MDVTVFCIALSNYSKSTFYLIFGVVREAVCLSGILQTFRRVSWSRRGLLQFGYLRRKLRQQGLWK
jgi:hypothetical protein